MFKNIKDYFIIKKILYEWIKKKLLKISSLFIKDLLISSEFL